MGHDLHADAAHLQSGRKRRWREAQLPAGADNDNFRFKFAKTLNMLCGQLINAAWFPQADTVRCDHHALRDGPVVDGDFPVAVGTDTVACKRILDKAHDDEEDTQAGAALQGAGKCAAVMS